MSPFLLPGLQPRLQWDPRKLRIAQRGRPLLRSRDQGQGREEEEGHRQSRILVGSQIFPF